MSGGEEIANSVWFYHKQGYSVVPFDGLSDPKTAIIPWKKYQIRLIWEPTSDNLTFDLSVSADNPFLLRLDIANGFYVSATCVYRCSNLHRSAYSGCYARPLL